MKKFDYVAEINLPSNSAYPLHVLKMCDAFAELNYKVTLFIFYKANKLNNRCNGAVIALLLCNRSAQAG